LAFSKTLFVSISELVPTLTIASSVAASPNGFCVRYALSFFSFSLLFQADDSRWGSLIVLFFLS